MSQDWGDIIRRYYDDEAARKIEDALSDMPEELVPDGICDRKELFVKDKLLFPYTPVNQGRFANPDQDPDQQTAAWESLVRATIPEDGRVALPFHFLRPLREEYIAWHEENSRYRKMTPKQILAMAGSARKSRYTELRSKQTLHYMDTHPEEGFCDAEQSFPLPREWPQRIADRIESAKSAMESFFCKDFGNFGNFIIQDIDPRTGQQISYDINSPKPRYGDGKEYWDKNYSFKLSAIADRQDQMATKGAFSTANQPPNRIAPWQRIICCEGLSLTSPAAKQNQLFPFQWELGWDSTLGMMAAKMHLSGILRGGNESANPYSHPDHAFHLTFFEKLQGLKVEMEDYYRARISIPDLKTGHLFGGLQRGRQDKPSAQRGWKQAFHRSSFTVHTVSADYEKHVADCWHWTMVILAPRDFFHIVGASSSLLAGDIIATGQASHQTAQLSRVVYALNKVGERWRELEEHIGDLLMEDFMDPVAYCQLLFDDSTFSRSRLYFWVLACLNEFDEVMEDNITQWTLYRAARVTPRLRSASEASSAASSPSSSPDPEPSEGGPPHKFNRAKDEAWFVELDRKAEQARRDLEKAREGFEVKKKRVIALRDGLFNASALIESRSSTRLGMNVQLLTYVSIFYLPMGFCAALWAVPNITDRQTQTPFVLTAVLTGLVTYLAVFNLENLARLPGRVYASRRERLVRQMERDGDEAWKGRSGEFEEFPPSAGQRRPSEWWIVGYQMLRLLRGLRKAAAFGIAVVVSYIDFIRRLPTSRRQREENSDEEKSDV